MSYDEYSDLFDKAQKNDTKYVAFVFDIKGSKKMSDDDRYIAQIKTFETIDLMTKKLKLLEKAYNRQILVRDDKLLPVLDSIRKNTGETVMTNPAFKMGDCFAFFCYNHSISEDLFKKLFIRCTKEVDNKCPYHFACGKFETLDYAEGGGRYYIGYIMEQLSKGSAKDNSEIINENVL